MLKLKKKLNYKTMGNLTDILDEPLHDIKEPEKKDMSGVSDLHSLFADYKEPAIVEQEKQPVTTTQTAQPQTNPNFPGAPIWYGNPLYYQSGKKQGQIKPPPKKGFAAAFQQPQMSVNPETSIMTADSIISGAMFLAIINLLLPMGFALINNLVVKDKRKMIDWELLQIDEKATKQLDTLASKALKSIKIDANPLGVFIFAIFGLYAMQFMTVKMLTDVQAKTDTKNGKVSMA